MKQIEIYYFRIGPELVSVTITLYAEVNLAWWLAWTSNPVVVYRKVGWVGSIPMHLRHASSSVAGSKF
jgi:hypothetical protein